MSCEFKHVPVLPAETVELISGACGGNIRRILDGTVGGGGHSSLLLKRFPHVELLGIDRDDAALAKAAETLAFAGKRVHLKRGNYSQMAELAKEAGWERVDAILLDIGVSSAQIDDGARGFSFRFDGPLDMRMDRTSVMTASRLLNQGSEAELERIFMEYGELDRGSAKRLTAAIAEQRKVVPFCKTSEFAGLCDKVLKKPRRNAPPVATLPFQALRIAVNGELDELNTGLNAAVELLVPGGRICVIDFHSLEDRIIKNFFRDMAALCKCPPGLPECRCGWIPKLEIVTKHPVTAGEAELAENPRSACAKLRAAAKISNNNQK